MKAAIAFAVLLSLDAASAQAKPSPVEPPAKLHPSEETAISVGPAGAMLESDYFRAPEEPFAAGRVFPCRLRLHPFEKTRLAQSCN